MNQREAFAKAIAANPHDHTSRMVFADWLDDQGEHEDAARQRKWPEARKYFDDLAVKYKRKAEDDARHYGDSDLDDLEYPSLEFILGRAEAAYFEAAETPDWSIEQIDMSCSRYQDLCDDLRVWSVGREFWRNWFILTGHKPPSDLEEGHAGYSCGC